MKAKQENEVMSGPNSRLTIRPLLLVTPAHLESLAQAYCLWANTVKTPTSYCLINDLSAHSTALDAVKVLLYSSQTDPSSDLYKLCGLLSLKHSKALTDWRLWPIDDTFNLEDIPSEYEALKEIYHVQRIKALSLLLGGVTLSTALKQGQQMEVDAEQERNPLMNAPNFADLEAYSQSPRSEKNSQQRKTKQYIYYFPESVLKRKVKEIESFGRRAYIPLLFGLSLFSFAVFALYAPSLSHWNTKILISMFVLGQLLFGTGVIALLWSVFEYRGLRQRVYLFWLDPHLAE